MSFFSRLKKLVDPVQGRLEEYNHLDDTPPPEPEAPAGEAPEEAEPRVPMVDEPEAILPDAAGHVVYRCKACGWTSPDPSYCPTCLADTMRKVQPPRRSRRR